MQAPIIRRGGIFFVSCVFQVDELAGRMRKFQERVGSPLQATCQAKASRADPCLSSRYTAESATQKAVELVQVLHEVD